MDLTIELYDAQILPSNNMGKGGSGWGLDELELARSRRGS